MQYLRTFYSAGRFGTRSAELMFVTLGLGVEDEGFRAKAQSRRTEPSDSNIPSHTRDLL